MRVKLQNVSAFFDDILNEKHITLIELSKQISIPYSTLKKWKGSKFLIPLSIFNDLITRIPDRKEYWVKRSELRKDTWGQSKGGRTWIKKLSKKDLYLQMEKIRESKQDYYLKTLNLTKNFCEFYGALLGDGCLCKFKRKDGYFGYEIVLSGNLKYDYTYHSIYLTQLIINLFNIRVRTYPHPSTGTIKTCFRNKNILQLLEKLGFPVGKKGKYLIIPKKIMRLSSIKKKALLRGLFDTDGCIFAKKREKYKYPHISISSISQDLLKQLKSILNSLEYSCYISGTDLRVRGKANINKWMSDIGTSNLRNKFKYQYWLEKGVLPAYLLENLGKRF